MRYEFFISSFHLLAFLVTCLCITFIMICLFILVIVLSCDNHRLLFFREDFLPKKKMPSTFISTKAISSGVFEITNSGRSQICNIGDQNSGPLALFIRTRKLSWDVHSGKKLNEEPISGGKFPYSFNLSPNSDQHH